MFLLIESVGDTVRAKHALDVSKCMYATIRTLPINSAAQNRCFQELQSVAELNNTWFYCIKRNLCFNI